MEYFIGIDVGKAFLDVYIDGLNTAFQVPNTPLGLQDLMNKLAEIKEGEIKLIVCEPTGGYEAALVECLRSTHLPVHIAHANKVRDFARAQESMPRPIKLTPAFSVTMERFLGPLQAKRNSRLS